MKNCTFCKYNNIDGFCEKMVVDMKWVNIGDKRVKSYYIDIREFDNEVRSPFIVKCDFYCNHYEQK